MIVQTRSVFANVPGKLTAASRKLQRQTNGLHNAVCDAASAVGSEIFSAVIGDFADQLDFGIDILHVQTKIGITLIVFQKNIIFRAVPFD